MSKTIVITGASSGIGNHMAKYFHNQGHDVIGISRKKPDNCSFSYYECDLSNNEQIKAAVKKIDDKVKVIDILINCAGVGTGGALEEVPFKDTKWVFDVNVFGVMELTRSLLPLLKKSSRAKIINIGSVAGEITIPYQVSYSMAKASIHRFTEGLRLELRPFKIDVSTVMPGDTKTGFTRNRKTIIPENSPYYKQVKRSVNKMEKDEQTGVSPIKVTKVINRLIKKRKMPVRVIVGLDYKILIYLSKILPKKLVESVVNKLYG